MPASDQPLTIKARVARDFDALMRDVPEALAHEGFGVLTEIDIQGTLRNKLGIEFRRYHIFGACHPDSAHRLLSSELDVGVLLPCNVVVYETDEGESTIAAVNPLQQIAAVTEDPDLTRVARDVHDRLERALALAVEPRV